MGQFDGRGYDNDKFGYLPGALKNDFITDGHNTYANEKTPKPQSKVGAAKSALKTARETGPPNSETRQAARAGLKEAKFERKESFGKIVSARKDLRAAKHGKSDESVADAKAAVKSARGDTNQNFHGSFQKLKDYSGGYGQRVEKKKAADKKAKDGGGFLSGVLGAAKKVATGGVK
jgi:hypothetical protein